MIRPLAGGYRAEVDAVDATSWYQHAALFSDANLYQVWQHGAGPERFNATSRLLVRKDEEIVAAAEVRLFLVPFLGRGYAYVRWGPLWRRHGGNIELEHFRQAIRALRNEYVSRRGLILRINPRLFDADHQDCVRVLEQEGLSPVVSRPVDTTLLMDLSPTLEVLRAGFDKKWRNCLSKAERSGLTLAVGTTSQLVDEFTTVYDEMLLRKQFAPTADIQKHRRIQLSLPDSFKMGVVVARHHGQPCAGAMFSAIGETALYLFGATNDLGLRTSGSYLVQWELLTHLKGKGLREYDLHGINITSNPGTYHFKKGLAGKHGRQVTFIGQRQASDRSVATYALSLAERLHRRPRTFHIAVPRAAATTGLLPE